MKGLYSYHLLNAASFQASSANVNGHIQFIGINGNGKTTNLRIPLYFYNPSSEKRDHGIEPNKSSFNNFYFKGDASYIIYEVNRANSDQEPDLYHIACYRSARRPPTFLFIDAPFSLDLYRTERNTLCREHELLGNLSRNNIPSYAAKQYKYFREIIYGMNTSKDVSRYVFAHPKPHSYNSIHTIPLILSSIFRAESLKTNTLKDALIASLGISEADCSIDLESMRRNLQKFYRTYEEIKTLLTHIKDLKTAHDLYQRYRETETQIRSLESRIAGVIVEARESKQLCEAEIENLRLEIKNAETDYRSKQDKVRKSLDNSISKIASLGTEKDKASELLRKHPPETIARKRRKLEELPSLREQMIDLSQQLKTLVKEFETIEEKYNTLEAQIKNSSQKQQDILIRQLLQKKEAWAKQRQDAQASNQQKLEQIDDRSENERIRINEEYLTASREHEQAKNILKSLNIEAFLKGDIREHESSLAEMREKQSSLTEELKHIRRDREVRLKQGENERLKINTGFEKEERKLTDKLKAIEITLSRNMEIVSKYEGSFLEHIDRSEAIPSESAKASIRESLLLTPANRVIMEEDTTALRNSLFGISIDPTGIPAVEELDFEAAQALSEELNKQVEHLKEDINTLRERHQNEIESSQNKEHEDRKTIQGKEERAQVELATLSNRIEQTRKHLKDLNEQREVLFNEAKGNAQQGLRTAKSKETEAKVTVDDFNKTLKKQKDEIRSAYNGTLNLIVEQEREETERNHAGQSSIQRDLDSKLDKLVQQKSDELKANSADENKTQLLRELIAELERKIAERQPLEHELKHFEEVIRPEIERLPEIEAKLHEAEKQKLALEKEQSTLEVEHEENSRTRRSKLRELDQKEKAIKEDIEAYEIIKIDSKTETSISLLYKPGDLKSDAAQLREERDKLKTLWFGSINAQASDSESKGITKIIDSMLSKFGADNHFNLPQLVSTEAEYRNLLEIDITKLLETDIIDRSKNETLNLFRGTLSEMERGYQKMEDNKQKLATTINAVAKTINSDNFVSAIEGIRFRLSDSGSNFAGIRSRVGACCEQLHSINLDGVQDDLFSRRANRSEVSLLMDETKELYNRICEKKLESISLSDLYDLEIQITENGKTHDFSSKVDGVGSEGTDTLVKIMIYVGILSHFKEKAFKNAEEIHLHCLVDEIGRIHSDYISELLRYCTSRGIYLATASPESHRRPSDFKNTFEIARSKDRKRATIKQVLTYYAKIDEKTQTSSSEISTSNN